MIKNNYFLILLLFLFSCKTPEPETKYITTATLRGPSAMAMIKMMAEKPVLDSVRQTSFIVRNEPNHVRAMILAEEVDFAVLPSTMAALLYNRQGSYLLAAIPVWGTLYLFGTDTTVNDWGDLKGKKISLMARGMTPDIMFRYLAGRNGLDPENDLKLDYSFPTHTELANAVSAGITDLGVIAEPMVSLAMRKNENVRHILNFNHEWNEIFGDEVPFAQTALLVKKDFAEKNPSVVEEYLRELEASIQWVNSHPDTAAELIAGYKILPETEVAEKAIPKCNLKFIRAANAKEGIEKYFKVFYNFSPLILGGKLPDDEFYYQAENN